MEEKTYKYTARGVGNMDWALTQEIQPSEIDQC